MAKEIEEPGETPDAGEDPDPRVVGVDSDDAESLIGALSSDTARDILTCLDEEPGTPSELAERLDTSIQNVRYHLEGLEDAGLIRVDDTRYSSKGREMDVYDLASGPVVVFPGGEDDRGRVKRALLDALAGAAVVAAGAAVVQRAWTMLGGGAPTVEDGAAFRAEPDGAAAGDGGAASNETVGIMTEQSGEAGAPDGDAAGQAGADLLVQLVDLLGEPGVAFLLGGLVAVAVAAMLRYRWGE